MLSIVDLLKRIKGAYIRELMGYAPLPKTVFIEVNYDCVLRCKMCQLWTRDFKRQRLGGRQVLSEGEIRRAIDEFASSGITDIFFIGGEPFLRKDLIDLIRYSKEKELSCATVSNGYLITEDLAGKIVHSGLDILAVSIDGPNREIHDRIRGVSGAFEHAVKAIRNIKTEQKKSGLELPGVAIACTVSSNNFQNLPDMIDLAKNLEVQKIRFQYISVIDKSVVEETNRIMGQTVIGVHNFVGIPSSYLVPKEEIEKLSAVLEEMKRRAGTQVECHFDPVFLAPNRMFMESGSFPVWDCSEPWKRSYMTPAGDFMPCPMFPDYNMGNIREESFEVIWNGHQARRLRKRLNKGLPPICRKCCVVHSGNEDRWKRWYRRLSGIMP
jgi:MoaA/NifB/PqqE/SkfB family radical SAM enzyme